MNPRIATPVPIETRLSLDPRYTLWNRKTPKSPNLGRLERGGAYKEVVSLGAETGAKEFAKIKEKVKTETRLSMILKTSGFDFLWKIYGRNQKYEKCAYTILNFECAYKF